MSLLRSRNVWAVIGARVLADPWVWFYYFWIPEYLTRSAGFTAADIGKYAWIPFAAQGVGIVLGGACSDLLCRRGLSVISARLTVMLIGMLLMTAGIAAAFELSITIIFAGISTAMLGFGLWAPNMMSLCADAFPRLGRLGGGLGRDGCRSRWHGVYHGHRLDTRSLWLRTSLSCGWCYSPVGLRRAFYSPRETESKCRESDRVGEASRQRRTLRMTRTGAAAEVR